MSSHPCLAPSEQQRDLATTRPASHQAFPVTSATQLIPPPERNATAKTSSGSVGLEAEVLVQLGFDVEDNGQQLLQGLLLVARHVAVQVLDLLPGAGLNLGLHVTLGTQDLHTYF